MSRHVTSETRQEYKEDGGRQPKTETVRSLVRLKARLGAWSMGWCDSDIGDTPAA
jgi:hypothetical protein